MIRSKQDRMTFQIQMSRTEGVNARIRMSRLELYGRLYRDNHVVRSSAHQAQSLGLSGEETLLLMCMNLATAYEESMEANLDRLNATPLYANGKDAP